MSNAPQKLSTPDSSTEKNWKEDIENIICFDSALGVTNKNETEQRAYIKDALRGAFRTRSDFRPEGSTTFEFQGKTYTLYSARIADMEQQKYCGEQIYSDDISGENIAWFLAE